MNTYDEIYFEIKNILPEKELEKNGRISTEIQSRMKELNEPFVFAIEFTSEFEWSDIKKFCLFAKKKSSDLYAITEITFPIEFVYPEKSIVPKALIKVLRISNNGKGYVLIMTPVVLLNYGKRIRERIKSAVKQLPENSRNVVVIDSSIGINIEHVFDALYGDTSILFSLDKERRDYQARFIRTGERIYGKFNRRISAVVFYKRKWVDERFQYTKTVIPNENPLVPLTKEFMEQLE